MSHKNLKGWLVYTSLMTTFVGHFGYSHHIGQVLLTSIFVLTGWPGYQSPRGWVNMEGARSDDGWPALETKTPTTTSSSLAGDGVVTRVLQECSIHCSTAWYEHYCDLYTENYIISQCINGLCLYCKRRICDQRVVVLIIEKSRNAYAINFATAYEILSFSPF